MRLHVTFDLHKLKTARMHTVYTDTRLLVSSLDRLPWESPWGSQPWRFSGPPPWHCSGHWGVQADQPGNPTHCCTACLLSPPDVFQTVMHSTFSWNWELKTGYTELWVINSFQVNTTSIPTDWRGFHNSFPLCCLSAKCFLLLLLLTLAGWNMSQQTDGQL